MPRQSSVTVDNNFSKALITEANGLNFPENACTDTDNCVFDLKGSVRRRLGMDLEDGYDTKVINRADSVIATYTWKNPASIPGISILAAQVGSVIYFWNIGSGDEVVSASAFASVVDLTPFKADSSVNPSLNECQFTAGRGKLFVSHPYLNPFYISYDAGTDVFTGNLITVSIRDFEGVVDPYAVDQRPTLTAGTMTDDYWYNKRNQGWLDVNLVAWDTARSDMPSNVDVMWSFKNSSDAFDASIVDNVMSGNSPASKGHYILNVFNQDRNFVSGLTDLVTVSTGTNRFSTIAFFAGRVFYSGLQFDTFGSKIYFSQIVEKDSQVGDCYQVNDPTSEGTFDLLPSDGGVISIPDAGTIIKLAPIGSGIAAFTTNGVWFITGSTGLGFTATDYSVSKISSVPTFTASSFVDVVGLPVWWNLDGIYALSEGGSSSAGIQVQSLTLGTIQDFYQQIPPSAKATAKGIYNQYDKKVQWLYNNSMIASSLTEQYQYNHALIFDTATKAFYPWSIDPNQPVQLHGIFISETTSGSVVIDNVVDDGGDQVVDDNGDDVIITRLGNAVTAPSFKYLVSWYSGGAYFFSVGEASNPEYLDWFRFDSIGKDYDSHFTTGYKIKGGAITDAQSSYIGLYTEPESEYTIQGIWDYSTTSSNKRWSDPQTVNTVNKPGFDLIYNRRKIRGRGKSLQIRVNSTPRHNFAINGWSLLTSAPASV